MTTILYPTRGGLSSYPNQDRVIELAKEKEANLIFLYVSDVEFLSSVARPALVDILETELDHMGEFLLAMAQERAANAGWKADAVIRRGNFEEALRQVITECGVNILVLGAPGKEHAVTTPKFLRNLMTRIMDEFEIQMIVLQDGDILEQKSPQQSAAE